MISTIVETTSPDVKHPDVQVFLGNLKAPEGNAYVILGRVERALKASRYDAEKYIEEATSGDYEELLDVTRRWVRTFEQRNPGDEHTPEGAADTQAHA